MALNGSVVVDSLLIVTPIVGFCNCSMLGYALLYVHSSFAIILMGKRELVALICLSSWCHVMVVWLFLAVPWVCMQFDIVVFPGHTHSYLYVKKVIRPQEMCVTENNLLISQPKHMLVVLKRTVSIRRFF